jgi:urease accessory protein
MRSTLHIEVAAGRGKTILKNCFANPPYKITDITEDKRQGTLHLMITSSSPGVLDKDHYEIDIEVAADSTLQLHTQSYQRIFTMQQQATQNMRVTIGKNSTFCFVPHPLVPHRNANMVTRAQIHLTENSSLIWGEIISCGRKLNGEVFQFTKYHSKTGIFYNNKLIIKENLLLEPAVRDLTSMGQLQQYTHQATFIFIDEQVNIAEVKACLWESLKEMDKTSIAISTTAGNGIIVRLLGQQAEVLFNCLNRLAEKAVAFISSQKKQHVI